MEIYDSNNNLLLDITVDDNSYRYRAIKGDNSLTLYYSLPEHLEIPIGAHCTYEGETFTLMRPEQLKMKHTRQYEYTVVLSSEQEKAKIWKFRNTVDGRLKFPLTAKPKEHLQMLVDNLNNREGGWEVGDCVDDVEKLINYDHDYCWDALDKMTSEFDTEFEFDGKRISLKKVEYNKSNPLPLAYGRGNGFKPGIGRSNTSENLPVETLYVQGGSTNIDRSKYPDSEELRAISNGCLLLPAGQIIAYDGEHFEDEEGYNAEVARHYIVDDRGLSIRNLDRELTSLVEDSLDRSDDYPKRVGVVSRVDVVGKDKNLYDIIDSSIPDNLNYEDYLIGDESMTIIFQSGELAGREFDVKYIHKEKIVNKEKKAGKRFEIVPQEIDGVMMPGDSFVPAAGDTYAVFHVMLPDAYIRDDASKSGASWDMFRAAVRYLFDNEQQKFSFTGELDSIWAKKNWLNVGGKIKLGGYVQFTHEQIAPEGVLVRIVGIKNYINNPHSPKIELSNEVVGESVASTLKQLGSTEVLIEENYRAALQFTKRRFRDAKETMEMIEAALSDNFSNRINPIAVETMSMLVGDERLQFQFVSEPGKTTPIPHNITFNETTKQLLAPSGTIQHLTLGIDSISSSHSSEEYLYWNVDEFISPALTSEDEQSQRYYLYIRAKIYDKANAKSGSAEFRLETAVHKLNEENGYYWLLVGILNSEYDSERSFVTLYGFTEVLPGRITTDRIVSANGDSYYDMLNNALKLGDKLQFNVDGKGELMLQGTMVQSRSGDTAPISCYRGKWDANSTYFDGDTVIYPIGGKYSLYRCIGKDGIKGIPPTSTAQWQIQASQGDNGTNGDYYEYRYAVNGSVSSHPAISDSERSPQGWTTAMPSIGSSQYLWQTIAKISGQDGSLVGKWSAPFRVTPKDGKDGENGVSPALVFRGDFNSSARYYGTSIRIECVKYGSTYYVTRTDAPGGINGFLGNDGLPTNTKYWNQFGASFESVATTLLLAENANIGGWIFRNGRLESQAQDSNGNPMAYLNGTTGECWLRGILRLSTAYNGNISQANIFYLPATTQTKEVALYCDLQQVGKVIRFYNSGKISSGNANYEIRLKGFSISDNTITATDLGAAVVRPEECVELTCFQTSSDKAEWHITSRFGIDNYRSVSSQGLYPRMVALGRVDGRGSNVSINGRLWDGRPLGSLFDVKKVENGVYKVTIKSGVGNILPPGYRIFCTGFGYGSSGKNRAIDARVLELNSDNFTIAMSDDDSLNDGACDIMILDYYWYHDLYGVDS